MLIGHNPGLQDLVLDLARSPRTAALATLEVHAAHWHELDHETAQIIAFVRPATSKRGSHTSSAGRGRPQPGSP